ncbi:hypothetical protein C1H76_8148 [Elsinoe australis]|uniref:Reverse transcriptase domain-containing protein n=1 Tax=Elsinoe australis TaxID=40998 RepID=A0A4V6DWA7_9PEZI|nr:hypothetical protein C1H76_8148 [Elsinoe australis]
MVLTRNSSQRDDVDPTAPTEPSLSNTGPPTEDTLTPPVTEEQVRAAAEELAQLRRNREYRELQASIEAERLNLRHGAAPDPNVVLGSEQPDGAAPSYRPDISRGTPDPMITPEALNTYIALEKNPIWESHINDVGPFAENWSHFQEWLKDRVMDKGNRSIKYHQLFHDGVQRERQSISDFAQYLEDCAEEIYDSPIDEIQFVNRLINGVKPEYRQGYMSLQNPPRGKDEVISYLTRLENVNRQPSDRGEPPKRPRTGAPRGRGQPRTQYGRFNNPRPYNNSFSGVNTTPVQPRKDVSELTCYLCNQKGYIRPNCSDEGGTAPRRLKVVANLLHEEREITPDKPATCLADSGADINFISQHYVKATGIRLRNDHVVRVRTLDQREVASYGYCYLDIETTDHYGVLKTVRQRFDAVEIKGYDLVLGQPWLYHINPDIDWKLQRWRHRDADVTAALLNADEFAEELDHGSDCYAVFLNAVVTDADPPAGNRLPDWLSSYQDVFDDKQATTIPLNAPHDHAIDLHEGKQPPWGPIYALAETELATLREYIDENLRLGRIRHSVSPAGAPILFVPKKDKSLRLCVDYRGLNDVSIKNRYPLPLITEMLDRVQGATVYTKIDLRDAYHRIRIRRGDEWKTAFRCRYGHFEYVVMPFGLANAPATFQAYISRCLDGLIDHICIVYMDDILIYSRDPSQHRRHVQAVLDRLRRHQLYAKASKCAFETKEIEFLRYVINADGVSMEPERIRAIAEWPEPQSIKDL